MFFLAEQYPHLKIFLQDVSVRRAGHLSVAAVAAPEVFQRYSKGRASQISSRSTALRPVRRRRLGEGQIAFNTVPRTAQEGSPARAVTADADVGDSQGKVVFRQAQIYRVSDKEREKRTILQVPRRIVLPAKC
jgi:hypothetical protein